MENQTITHAYAMYACITGIKSYCNIFFQDFNINKIAPIREMCEECCTVHRSFLIIQFMKLNAAYGSFIKFSNSAIFGEYVKQWKTKRDSICTACSVPNTGTTLGQALQLDHSVFSRGCRVYESSLRTRQAAMCQHAVI